MEKEKIREQETEKFRKAGKYPMDDTKQSSATSPSVSDEEDHDDDIFELGKGPWTTLNPFIFCVYHVDHYPEGNNHQAPSSHHLKGRNIGSDFSYRDGWSMYHGTIVPGFPQHPHRGFETITYTRKGIVDHTDSLGATGRYGQGDVQWMTAGKGVQHAEMFPLIKSHKRNTLELFQIWLNLPAKDKMAEPAYQMFWAPDIPVVTLKDANGKTTKVTICAGSPKYFPSEKFTPLSPPPNSWANKEENDVAVWTVKMEAGATVTLPPAIVPECNRAIYFFEGDELKVGETSIKHMTGIKLDAKNEVKLQAGDKKECEVLLLQGRPIREPMAHYGPFVMNTDAEVRQAMKDYEATHFGGWKWNIVDFVHPRSKARFAQFPDGRVEHPPS